MTVLVLNLLALYLAGFGVSYTRQISPALMQHNRGYAYVVSIAHDWPLVVRSSNIEQPYRADTRVFEDGVLLGPTHLRNDTVRRKGGGMYSHWGERLFFSASDNSDPKMNGRAYTATYTLFLAPSVLVVVALVDLVLFGAWLFRTASARAALAASRSDLACAGVAAAAGILLCFVAYQSAGALFWVVLGGAAVAALWGVVFLARVTARLRSKEPPPMGGGQVRRPWSLRLASSVLPPAEAMVVPSRVEDGVIGGTDSLGR